MELNSYWLILGVLVLYYGWKTFGPGRKAPASEVARKLAGGAAILDVRTPAEFRTGAYPRARNIPLDELEGRLASLGTRDKPVVVYCASGSRSSQAARILRKAGFSDVVNAGGIGSMPR